MLNYGSIKSYMEQISIDNEYTRTKLIRVSQSIRSNHLIINDYIIMTR